jgi:hypothetical protein
MVGLASVEVLGSRAGGAFSGSSILSLEDTMIFGVVEEHRSEVVGDSVNGATKPEGDPFVAMAYTGDTSQRSPYL